MHSGPSASEEQLRTGNRHILVENLHTAPILTVPDEASRGGGLEGDAKPQLQELKVIFPGFSRQAFAKLLEHRTNLDISTATLCSAEFSYASFEEDQLCC
ncbi:hypothetical protein FSCOSCO3_A032444, partial [Scomber scombrus]